MQKFLVITLLVQVIAGATGREDLSHVSHNMDEDGYVFEYSVVDGDSSWMQSHGEWSDGTSTHGSYNVQLPDGRIQKVIYTADERGFRPVISYENPLVPYEGYGWRNHIGHDGIKGYGGYAKDDAHLDHIDHHSYGHHLPSLPPPFYEMNKFYDSSRPGIGSSYDDQEISSYAKDQSEEDATYMDKPHKLHSSAYAAPPKKVVHPVYHMVEKYQQGALERPKYGLKMKDSFSKYPMEKAKTYYMNKMGHVADSSEEEDSESEESVEVTSIEESMAYSMEEDKVEDMSFTPKPESLYRADVEISEESSEMREESTEEAMGEDDMKEETEESSEEEGSEESEEHHDMNYFIAKMRAMVPPENPYSPPTYFLPSSSEPESSEESTEGYDVPEPTTTSEYSSEEDLDTPPPAIPMEMPPLPSKSYDAKGLSSPPMNIIATPLYPPFHPHYGYHAPNYGYHHLSPFPIPNIYKPPPPPHMYHVPHMHDSAHPNPHAPHPYPLTPRYAHHHTMDMPMASYSNPTAQVEESGELSYSVERDS